MTQDREALQRELTAIINGAATRIARQNAPVPHPRDSPLSLTWRQPRRYFAWWLVWALQIPEGADMRDHRGLGRVGYPLVWLVILVGMRSWHGLTGDSIVPPWWAAALIATAHFDGCQNRWMLTWNWRQKRLEWRPAGGSWLYHAAAIPFFG